MAMRPKMRQFEVLADDALIPTIIQPMTMTAILVQNVKCLVKFTKITTPFKRTTQKAPTYYNIYIIYVKASNLFR